MKIKSIKKDSDKQMLFNLRYLLPNYRRYVLISQKTLARYLMVNQASISLWERGLIIPAGPAWILLRLLLKTMLHPEELFVANRNVIYGRIFLKGKTK